MAAFYKVLSMCVLKSNFLSVFRPKNFWDPLLENFFLLNNKVAVLSLLMVISVSKTIFQHCLYQLSLAADFLFQMLYATRNHQQTVQPYYVYRRLTNRLYTAKKTPRNEPCVKQS